LADPDRFMEGSPTSASGTPGVIGDAGGILHRPPGTAKALNGIGDAGLELAEGVGHVRQLTEPASEIADDVLHHAEGRTVRW
jgi:hypothetical protein